MNHKKKDNKDRADRGRDCHRNRRNTQSSTSSDAAGGNENEDVVFMQETADVRCYNCNETGHYARDCTQLRRERTDGNDIQMLMYNTLNKEDYDFSFMMVASKDPSVSWADVARLKPKGGRKITLTNRHIRNSHWIPLDSQSTVNLFANKKFLSNIRDCGESCQPLTIHTNGRTQTTRMKGHLAGFGDVWYNPDSLVNILLMASVRKKCRITMDTSQGATINVHRKDGTMIDFVESSRGLYFYDALADKGKDKSQSNNYIMVSTVAENKT